MKDRLIYLTNCDSTNKEAFKRLSLAEINKPIAIYTAEQYSGKGQGDHVWISEPHKNITLSFVFKLNKWRISNHFSLSQCISLSIIEFLRPLLPSLRVEVKWPNDILVGSKKMAGILIENVFEGDFIRYSIVGVGININQKDFGSSLPNAVSLLQCTGKEWDLDLLVNQLYDAVDEAMRKFENTNFTEICTMYNNFLYKKNELTRVRMQNTIHQCQIVKVEADGKLVILKDGESIGIYHHEGQILIDNE